MGIFDKISKNATILKLQGDIALLDRQMTQRKSQFGIDLYDLITNLHDNKIAGGMIKVPSLFSHNENVVKEPYELVHFEITNLLKEMDAKNLEILHISSARERAKPAITATDTMKKAGSRITDAAQESKLQVDIALLERKIKQKKEQFGIDVYDLVVSAIASAQPSGSMMDTATTTESDSTADTSSPPSNRKTNSVKNLFGGASKALSKNLSKLNSSESDIKNCVLLAKRDVDFIIKQKNFKLKEIETLKSS